MSKKVTARFGRFVLVKAFESKEQMLIDTEPKCIIMNDSSSHQRLIKDLSDMQERMEHYKQIASDPKKKRLRICGFEDIIINTPQIKEWLKTVSPGLEHIRIYYQKP